MYKLGQVILILAVAAMIVISVLLILSIIDARVAGGIFIISLILAGAGISISRKHKK